MVQGNTPYRSKTVKSPCPCLSLFEFRLNSDQFSDVVHPDVGVPRTVQRREVGQMRNNRSIVRRPRGGVHPARIVHRCCCHPHICIFFAYKYTRRNTHIKQIMVGRRGVGCNTRLFKLRGTRKAVFAVTQRKIRRQPFASRRNGDKTIPINCMVQRIEANLCKTWRILHDDSKCIRSYLRTDVIPNVEHRKTGIVKQVEMHSIRRICGIHQGRKLDEYHIRIVHGHNLTERSTRNHCIEPDNI